MKKLFTNDKFFLLTVAVAVISQVLYAIYVSVPIFRICQVQLAIFLITIVCCELALFISYKEHAKNVMKGVMGAMLMAFFIESQTWLNSAGSDKVFGTIFCFALGVLVINHFIINSERKARPGHIMINQFLIVIIPVLVLVWDIVNIVQNPSAALVISSLLEVIMITAALACVVCVESRLDLYRQRRQAAGWTEEEGYPEEYDRTKYYG